MSKSQELIKLVSESDIELTSKRMDKLREAASKMVDQIESRRDLGKYSINRRVELENIFFNNMISMIQGEIND